MDKKLFFQINLKKLPLPGSGIFWRYGKKRLFVCDLKNTEVWTKFYQSNLKRTSFSRNVAIFEYMDKKRLFEGDLKITQIWTKTYFFKVIQKQLPFPELWIFSKIWVKNDFLIQRYDKKRFFQSNLKTTSFFSKCGYFRKCRQTKTF